MFWYSHLFKYFPRFVVIHTVQGFGVVNKAEVDVFLELQYFSKIPQNSYSNHESSLLGRLPLGFPCGSASKESSCKAGGQGSINLYAEYLMRNTGLDKAQAGIKIAGRDINNLRYEDDTTLMAESEEELKSLLMKVRE